MIADKIKTRSEIAQLCENYRRKGLIIGFTSGAFDFLHAGHVDYLEKAKARCDVLIVGLNSDQSIKKYKGENRPVISEAQRLKVIAAVEFVDYVFLFEERRNHENIKQLKPDYYFKAGDYNPDQLTSKEIVEELGGKAELIAVTENISTTEIIDRIAKLSYKQDDYREDQPGVGYFDRRSSKKEPAIFLDRDGTINKEIGYLHEPEKFEILPNVIAGLKKFRNMGFRLVVITNQGGIGLGYFTKEDFYRVNKKMMTEISKAGILIDKIYFCPHSLADNCSCRKPGIDLIKRAEEDLNIDMSHSYFIGDSWVDIEAGKNAGMKTLLIKSALIKNISDLKVKPDYIINDLLEAANIILEEERK